MLTPQEALKHVKRKSLIGAPPHENLASVSSTLTPLLDGLTLVPSTSSSTNLAALNPVVNIVASAEFDAEPISDADGCVESIFHFLWRKGADGQPCPGINLPDTIVYKYRQPAYWFFMSVKDGCVSPEYVRA